MYDLYELSEAIGQKLDKLCEIFELPYRPTNKYLNFPCPIHDGNKSALTIFLQPRNGLSYNWRCYTGHCEDIWGKSIISLIYALLNKQDNSITRKQAIEWCYSFTGTKPNYIHKTDDNQKKEWVLYNQIFSQEIIMPKFSTNDIRERLIVPSEYYLNRGYSKDILYKYNVGTCFDKTKEMFMRSIFPIMDMTGQYMIGCVGRSINEKCPTCDLYHYNKGDCPNNPLAHLYYSKWRNNNGFMASKFLFNLWYSQHTINKTETVILLEGQGDCLKLEESNIHNSVGLFGDDITDNQCLLLENLNCRNVIIGTDNDKAGLKAREKITSKLERMYNIYYLDYTGKDAGETSIEELQQKYRKIYGKIH